MTGHIDLLISLCLTEGQKMKRKLNFRCAT